VDFSHSTIFMTSNLGAAEMSALVSPTLGFNACDASCKSNAGEPGESLKGKIERSGMQAARRKFTPEFINRLDKIVTFQPLGRAQLRKLLDIELDSVQQRVFAASYDRSFVFQATEQAKSFLLEQGIDTKYGARYLKRAIERLLVQPMSNLIATDQLRGGDYIRVDPDLSHRFLTFTKEAEALPVREIVNWTELPMMFPELALANGATAENSNKPIQIASKRR
jgi:ATP-dependent Clp protease ATP-binding subunit ClpB